MCTDIMYRRKGAVGDNMVKPIMKDIFFLNQKSETATKVDNPVVQDLLDTLKANEVGYVGMATNMIGVKSGLLQPIWEYSICR
jgi:peptide deformylase